MAALTAKELAKMAALAGRAEANGTIDDEDVKALMQAMDDAALPVMVQEENWRQAAARRKARNARPATPDSARYVPFSEKDARLDGAIRMLQDKLNQDTSPEYHGKKEGEVFDLFRGAVRGAEQMNVNELIPAMRETLNISEADLSEADLQNMVRATTARLADKDGNLDLRSLGGEAERLMRTWHDERLKEDRLQRETPMQRARRMKKEGRDPKSAGKAKRAPARVVERLDARTAIDAETGETTKAPKRVAFAPDLAPEPRASSHLRPLISMPVRPPGSPPQAAKDAAAKRKAAGLHWGQW